MTDKKPDEVAIDPNNSLIWPYFRCPSCNGGNITRAFSRCIDCGVKIKWERR